MAWRYGVGVGREGFEWRGRTRIGRKETWPSWTPPSAMLKRRPDLPRYMAGGEDNPLGARAMYLYSGERDTGFRIHGSNEPWTIGHAVSSGCIRMLNEDVTDLFNRVKVGARRRRALSGGHQRKARISPGLSYCCGASVLIGMSSCGQLTTRLLVKLNASWIGIQTPIIIHPRLCCLRP